MPCKTGLPVRVLAGRNKGGRGRAVNAGLALAAAGAYARSIVGIATAMTVLPARGYPPGIFDVDIFERIRRLIERPVSNLKSARLLLSAGLAALVFCGAAASNLALSVRAQGRSGGAPRFEVASIKTTPPAVTRGFPSEPRSPCKLSLNGCRHRGVKLNRYAVRHPSGRPHTGGSEARRRVLRKKNVRRHHVHGQRPYVLRSCEDRLGATAYTRTGG
jgi:hypothetical protein